jgi:hypothetical protein
MTVGQPQGLASDAFEAEVGVLGAEVAGPGQRGAGERAQRQGGKVWIDLSHRCNLSRPTKRAGHDWWCRDRATCR